MSIPPESFVWLVLVLQLLNDSGVVMVHAWEAFRLDFPAWTSQCAFLTRLSKPDFSELKIRLDLREVNRGERRK